MKTFTKVVSVAAAAFCLLAVNARASLSDSNGAFAVWNFEVSQPVTAGPISPEVGSGSASGFHSGATIFSTPAGNGSAHSYSANGWSTGDYWQFSLSTVGYSGIQLGWEQVSSTTGPRDYELDWSTDGSTFTPFASYAVRSNAAPAWSSVLANYTPLDDYRYNLSSVSALDNQTTVYFRLLVTSIANNASNTNGPVLPAGTDRVDDFFVTGTVIPEPSTIMLVGAGLVGLLALRRRRS